MALISFGEPYMDSASLTIFRYDRERQKKPYLKFDVLEGYKWTGEDDHGYTCDLSGHTDKDIRKFGHIPSSLCGISDLASVESV